MKYAIVKNEIGFTTTKSKQLKKLFEDYSEAWVYIIDLPKSKAHKTIKFTYEIIEVNA